MKAKMIAFAFPAILVALLIAVVYAEEERLIPPWPRIGDISKAARGGGDERPIPPLPHAFYGSVEINGSPAPIGTVVQARGEGVGPGYAGNPVVTTVVGHYGGPGGLDPKLIVQQWIAEGATLTFYVNGSPTGQTASWHSGEVTELDLSLTTNGTCR